MQRYVDEADITVRSGDGGSGAVSFRREKYIPRGGPDGGDGGDGGDVIIRVNRNLRTLYGLKLKRIFRAQNGRSGSGQNKTGARGRDCIIPMPPGTVVIDMETGKVLFDLTGQEGERTLLRGGRGGYGNAHFATSTNQTPRFARSGGPGREMQLTLHMKTIADVGLVGLPNAGKSTLLSVLTDAHPRIGDYPFTTLYPNLGVMNYRNEREIVIADIPGLIEGAHEGHGLGVRFLKHIERTKALLFLIDLSGKDYLSQYHTLKGELESYSTALLKKPFIIVGSKADAASDQERVEFLHMTGEAKRAVVSSFTRSGLQRLKDEIVVLMEQRDER